MGGRRTVSRPPSFFSRETTYSHGKYLFQGKLPAWTGATLLLRIEIEGLSGRFWRKLFPSSRQWRHGIVDEVANVGLKIRLVLQRFVKFTLMNNIDT